MSFLFEFREERSGKYVKWLCQECGARSGWTGYRGNIGAAGRAVHAHACQSAFPILDPAAQLEAEMDADVCAGCGLADLPLGKFRRCRFCAELNTLKNTQPPPPPPPPPQVCYGAITGLEGSSHGLLDRPSRGPYRVWEWPDYAAMLSVIIGLIALILILSTA